MARSLRIEDVGHVTKNSGAVRFFWVGAAVLIALAVGLFLLSKRGQRSAGQSDGTILTEENIYGAGVAHDGTTVSSGSAGGVGAPPAPGDGTGLSWTPAPPGGHRPPPRTAPHGHPIYQQRGTTNPWLANPTSAAHSRDIHAAGIAAQQQQAQPRRGGVSAWLGDRFSALGSSVQGGNRDIGGANSAVGNFFHNVWSGY